MKFLKIGDRYFKLENIEAVFDKTAQVDVRFVSGAVGSFHGKDAEAWLRWIKSQEIIKPPAAEF
jgi:hypothetical protein